MNVKIALCAIFVVMGATVLVEAKYDISSYTIDNGGGVSTDGAYIVRGTIGQPDAVYSEGASYELLGGLWPGEPSCFVNFEHFARVAEYWLESGTDLPADLYADS
jgi:hypothetical protein